MGRITDMYAGTAKNDEKDAFIVVYVARIMPYTLGNLIVSTQDGAVMGILSGLEEDLARQVTSTGNLGYARVHAEPRRWNA